MTDIDRPLLHICYASADRGWVHGRMVCELGLHIGQYLTREDDGLGELQLQAITNAVEQSRFTVLIASSAGRWDKLAQFAAGLAQHAALEGEAPRLIIIARDFAPSSDAKRTRLSLGQRALVGLDCSDETTTTASLARLREILELDRPIDARPECPYPGLARFTAANRDLLFGRDQDKANLVQRIRAGHSRLLIVGPSGSGKSSLIHAAVLPELAPGDHLVHVVPRSDCLAAALRDVVDELEVPDLGATIDAYVATVRGATDAEIDEARTCLRTCPVADDRRRVVVIDPLEEVFAEEDAAAHDTLFTLLGGLWSMPWCTVILCMRADFYGALMAERCWRELESCQYPVAPLHETGLRAAIVEPATREGVHVDAALVERLIREIDRDRSSVPLPLLQVALKELWAHLRWRYMTLTDYEQIVDRDQRGLAAVLAVHADSVMQQLVPGERAVAQRILLDLVHLGEGRPHTRRRRMLDDLRRSGDASEHFERVLDHLIEGRLVTMGDGAETRSGGSPEAGSSRELRRFGRHVDLAHDTLITGWPELAGWIAARRDDLRTQRRLETRAASGVLLTGGELPEFLRWVESTVGQPLGASDALHVLIRRSVVARRIRRVAMGAGLIAVMAIAIVFAIQAQRLRAEKAKTQQSISNSMETANAIVYEVDRELRKVAGAWSVRERVLKRSRELISRLRALGDFKEEDQRTAMAGMAADAQLAVERGQLEQAFSLRKKVLADAQRRAVVDPSNTDWQRDLTVSYSQLGDVAVHARKLDDARSWFDQALAVAQKLAVTDPSNTEWQRDLSASYNRLGDLAVRVGKLDEAGGWFDKTLAVAQKLAAVDPSNTEWQRDLAVSYSRLGDVAMSAGKLDEARGWFDKALAVRRALAAADPNNAAWQRDLSVSYNRLGDVAVRAGTLDEARGWFNQDLAVVQKLAAADPCNTEWQHALSASYGRLGDVAVSAGTLDEARGWFDKALAVAQKLATTYPTSTEGQRELSVPYSRLGEIAMRAGNLDEAHGWFDQALAVAQKLAAADPSNIEWQHDLSAFYCRLGEVAVSAGKPDEARGWFDKALAMIEKLAGADPSNTDWQRDLSAAYSRLGDLAVSTGNLDEARSWFDQDLAVAQKLAAADPNNTEWQSDLSASYSRLGDLAVSAGKLDDARGWFDKILAMTRKLAAADPSNAKWQRNLSVSYSRLGDLAVSAGKLDDAHGWFNQAVAVTQKVATSDPRNTDWQRDLSAFYSRLGEVALSMGKLVEARGWFAQSLAVVQKLAAANPSNTQWWRDLSVSYNELGDVAVSEGKFDEARGWFDQGLAAAQKLVAANPSNAQWQRDLSVSYEKMGNIAVSAGKLDEARGWFDQSLAVVRKLAAANPSNTQWQRDLCINLVQIAFVVRDTIEAKRYRREARAVYDRLKRSGIVRGDAQLRQVGQDLN